MQAQYRTPRNVSSIPYVSTAQCLVPSLSTGQRVQYQTASLSQYRTPRSSLAYPGTARHIAPHASSVPHSA
eukprot:2901125-Rhodomonas_salina.2